MKTLAGNGSLSSGELADLAGVSRDTLRHYERKGVLPRPLRGHNGYRRYPSEALQRVQLVRRALSFGFTLDELARVLTVRDAGGAAVRISTKNPNAVKAIHDFLRFQSKEHKTGDSLDLPKRAAN